MTTWLRPEDCRLDDLRAVLASPTDPADYPYARTVEQQVPVYDAGRLREALGTDRPGVQAELVRALGDGPASSSSRAPSPPTWSTAPARFSGR